MEKKQMSTTSASKMVCVTAGPGERHPLTLLTPHFIDKNSVSCRAGSGRPSLRAVVRTQKASQESRWSTTRAQFGSTAAGFAMHPGPKVANLSGGPTRTTPAGDRPGTSSSLIAERRKIRLIIRGKIEKKPVALGPIIFYMGLATL